MNLSASTPTETSRRLILAALIPVAAFGLQWFFWAAIQPYVWFLFFPAVFFSSWVGGLRGGLVATVLSAGLVWYFFIPAQFSFGIQNPMSIVSIGMFVVMGVLFSLFHGRLWKANQQVADAVAAVQAANDQLEARVLQRTAELQQANAELREGEERLRSVLQHSNTGLWDWDLRTNAVYFSPEWKSQLGHADHELPNRFEEWETRLHPEDHDRAVAATRAFIQQPAGIFENESRLRHKNGAYVWILTRAWVQQDAGGNSIRMFGIHLDITERKRADEALNASEIQYRRLFEAAKDGILILDAGTGMIVDVNPFLVQLLGSSHEAFLGKQLWELGFFKDIVANQAHFAELLEREYIRYEDRPLETSDGRRVDVEFISNVYLVNGHKVIQCNIRDITERIHSRKTLREREETWRKLFNESADGMILAHPGTRTFRSVNQPICRMLGYSEAELLKLGVADLHPPADLPAVLEAFHRQARGELKVAEALPVVRKDGSIFFADITAAIVVVDGERLLLGAFRDVTARQQAEAALRESHERYHLLFDRMLDGFALHEIICDPQGRPCDYRFLEVNPAFERLTGLKASDVIGRTVLQVLPDIEPVWLETYGRVALSGESIRFQNYTAALDKHFEVVVFRPRPNQFATIFADITARKQAETELARHREHLEQLVSERTKDLAAAHTAALSLTQDAQRQERRVAEALARQRELAGQLEAANQELESFSYSVSHDLRAPLRHVHGYVEMLAKATEGQLSDKARRYLKTITEASVEMGQLIDDLLAFSRMGRAEMLETTVDLDQMVKDGLRGLEMATKDRNITWKIAPLPSVVADPAMLRQVLANLIGNAVKYSRQRDPAEIEIGCAGEENGRVIFFVRDNGAGFDMEYAHKLFGVFQRLHRAEDFEGTGIGLATVRRILARHGDRIWAESAPDKGATFYFTLKRVKS